MDEAYRKLLGRLELLEAAAFPKSPCVVFPHGPCAMCILERHTGAHCGSCNCCPREEMGKLPARELPPTCKECGRVIGWGHNEHCPTLRYDRRHGTTVDAFAKGISLKLSIHRCFQDEPGVSYHFMMDSATSVRISWEYAKIQHIFAFSTVSHMCEEVVRDIFCEVTPLAKVVGLLVYKDLLSRHPDYFS